MDDIATLLKQTRPDHAPDLDIERLQRRGGRRRNVIRLGGAVGAIAAIAFVVALVGLPSTSVSISPAGPGGGQPPNVAWQDMKVDQALDALVSVNQSASAEPAPTDGRTVVRRTVGVQDRTPDAPLLLHEVHIGPARRTIYRIPIKRVDVPPTAPELRAFAAAAMHDVNPDRLVEDAEPMGTYQSDTDATVLADSLQGAQREAEAGDPHAFTLAADALRLHPQPADRAMALTAIAELDEVEYRGHVRNILGQQGVGIAAQDQATGLWHALIFDTDTGRLIGEMTEDPQDGTIIQYTATSRHTSTR